MKNVTASQWQKLRALALIVLAVASALPLSAKSITYNNAAGSGEWSTTATNWTVNPYVDGDAVTFDTAVWAGNIAIPATVAPGSITIRGSGWPSGIPSGTPFVFSGADITGSTLINHIQDKTAIFLQDNLSFTGGVYLTSNGARIQFHPSTAGLHQFGTGPIHLYHASTYLQFNPQVTGASLSNHFVINTNIIYNWNYITSSNSGLFAGTLAIRPGGGLSLVTGNLYIPVTIKSNATFNVCNTGGGVGYLSSSIASDETGPHDLYIVSSGNGDHRVHISGATPWGVKNVERRVSAAGQWGTVFLQNEDVLFRALATNGGAFKHLSGTTAFGTTASPVLTGTINFPLIFNGGGFFGASTVNLNLTGGGSLQGTGTLFRTANYSTVAFNTNVNVNLNPGGVLAMANGRITGTLALNAGSVSNLNGGVTVDNGTNNAILFHSGSTRLVLDGSGTVAPSGSGKLSRTPGNGATAAFTGSTLGSSGKVTGSNGSSFNAGGLVPWARAGATTADTFATYDATAGFIPLAAYTATDDLTDPGNVDLTALNTVAPGDADPAVNALRLSSGGQVAIDPARTVTVVSGGLIALAGNGGIAGGTLAFGSAEAVLHTLGNLTLSSAVTGSGGLTKDGAGTLTLNGANSLGTNNTAVNAGLLVLGSDQAIGSGALTVQPGAAFDLAGYDVSVAGLRDNAGENAGGLVTNSSASPSDFRISNAVAAVFSGTIAGDLSVIKSGTGAQTLNASNAYSGGTVLYAGTLGLGHDQALGPGSLTVTGGTLQAVGSARTITNSLVINGDFAIGGAYNLALAAPIQLTANRILTVNNTGITTLSGGFTEDSAGRTLSKAGTGILILSGDPDYTGATIISNGPLRFADGLPGGVLIFNGGDTAVLESSNLFSRALGTGAGQVQWQASGGFAAWGAPLTVQLNGNDGAVTWASGNFVPNNKYLVLGSATANEKSEFRNGLNLNGGNRVINVIDNPNTTNDIAVLSGHISNGTLSKVNAGTLRVTSSNSFTGGFQLPNTIGGALGTLELGHDYALGGGTISIGYGVTITFRNITGGALTLTNRIAQLGGGSQSLILTGGDFNLTGDLALNNGQGNLTALAGTRAVFSGALRCTDVNVNGPGTLEFTGFLAGGNLKQAASGVRLGMGMPFGNTKMTLSGQPSMTLYAVNGPQTFTNTIALAGYGDNYFTFSGTNAITFSGPVTDESGGGNRGYNHTVASGVVLTISGPLAGNRGTSDNYHRKYGTGLMVLSGPNTNNFRTIIADGVLRANDGVGLPATSYLRLDGGVLEGNGTFSRTLAAHPANTANGDNQFRWNGSAGFSAFGGPLTVDINGGGAGTFTWASTANFLGASHTLALNSAFANDAVTLIDHINLNGAIRTMRVDDNPAVDTDFAVLTGALSGTGAAGLLKTGAGTLFLDGTNTFTNVTTVAAGGLGGDGSLAGRLDFNDNTRFAAVIGKTLDVAGTLTIGTNCTLAVSGNGSGVVLTHSGSLNREFANWEGLGRRIVRYEENAVRVMYPYGTIIVVH